MIQLDKEEILKNISQTKNKKVGYVSIIGRPNAGKSTFINTLIGEKISITSDIPQTTRKRVLAIYNDQDSQIIFFDTPGIHKSEKEFNEKINMQATNSLNDADLVLYFIDSTREGGDEEHYIKKIVSSLKIPIIKVYTKSDLKSKIDISQPTTKKISSTTKEGFNELIEEIKKYFKTGPLLYPEDYYTSQDIYFRISEIVREKIFLNTKEELPHSVFVELEEIGEEEEGLLKLLVYIYTETNSQKYIIIGKEGSLLSQIGKQSRHDLQQIFDKKIYLKLRVKVLPKWRKREKILKKVIG